MVAAILDAVVRGWRPSAGQLQGAGDPDWGFWAVAVDKAAVREEADVAEVAHLASIKAPSWHVSRSTHQSHSFPLMQYVPSLTELPTIARTALPPSVLPRLQPNTTSFSVNLH